MRDGVQRYDLELTLKEGNRGGIVKYEDVREFIEKTRALVEAVKKIDEIDWAFAHSENMIGEDELALIADAVESLADHPLGKGE